MLNKAGMIYNKLWKCLWSLSLCQAPVVPHLLDAAVGEAPDLHHSWEGLFKYVAVDPVTYLTVKIKKCAPGEHTREAQKQGWP